MVQSFKYRYKKTSICFDNLTFCRASMPRTSKASHMQPLNVINAAQVFDFQIINPTESPVFTINLDDNIVNTPSNKLALSCANLLKKIESLSSPDPCWTLGRFAICLSDRCCTNERSLERYSPHIESISRTIEGILLTSRAWNNRNWANA